MGEDRGAEITQFLLTEIYVHTHKTPAQTRNRLETEGTSTEPRLWSLHEIDLPGNEIYE